MNSFLIQAVQPRVKMNEFITSFDGLLLLVLKQKLFDCHNSDVIYRSYKQM